MNEKTEKILKKLKSKSKYTTKELCLKGENVYNQIKSYTYHLRISSNRAVSINPHVMSIGGKNPIFILFVPNARVVGYLGGETPNFPRVNKTNLPTLHCSASVMWHKIICK